MVMDLHGTDDWIFEELEDSEDAPVNQPKPMQTIKKRSDNVELSSLDEINALKQTIRNYELQQKTKEAEKQIFMENFYRLLITARTQIKELEQKNAELEDRLTSYMSVKCPNCDHCFRCNDSRILPNYVRYISACKRLELDFSTEIELKRWLVVSNLDTDANGLPVIRANSPPKTLKATGSQLLAKKKDSRSNDDQMDVDCRSESNSSRSSNRFRLEVENVSSHFSIKEIKATFEKVGPVLEARFSETERNKAIIYFQNYRHLKRSIEKYQGKTWNGRRIRLVDRSKLNENSPKRRRDRSS